MTSSHGLINWLKKQRIGLFFLITALILECLYFFQSWVDAELKDILKNLQRTNIKAFKESSLVPLTIYILIVKLGFLWRIPFLVYLFRLISAVSKERRQPYYNIIAFLLFLLPFYLALFLMPSTHWFRVPQETLLPAGWIWITLPLAVILGFLYETFESKYWNAGRLDLPYLFLISIIPYFLIDLAMQFLKRPVHGLHIIFMLCVSFSLFFTISRKLILRQTAKEKISRSVNITKPKLNNYSNLSNK